MHMYKNSLILRLCITEKPFIHKHAYTNMFTNFMFHDEFAKNFKNYCQKGIINVGGKRDQFLILPIKIKLKFTKKNLIVNFLINR